jgi:hypothetical protein
MAYTHTNLAIDNRLDIVSKYKELVDLTSNGKNMYVRSGEVIRC